MDIICVTGVGRSGTTLVEQYLAAATLGVALGETELFWQRAILRGERCGCGRTAGNCSVWSKVAESGIADADIAQVIESERRRSRSILVSWIPWFGALYDMYIVRRQLSESRFGEAVRAMFQTLSRATESEILIDSSKKPVYAAVLSTLEEVNVHVVHVVRDVRGYVWSMKKKGTGGLGNYQAMIRSGILMSTMRWVRGHRRARLVGNRVTSYAVLRYEDFVDRPSEEIDRVVRELALEKWRVDPWRGLAPSETWSVSNGIHQIAGNPIRMIDGRLPVVEADDKWMRHMPKWQKVAIGLLAYAGLRRYRYALRA